MQQTHVCCSVRSNEETQIRRLNCGGEAVSSAVREAVEAAIEMSATGMIFTAPNAKTTGGIGGAAMGRTTCVQLCSCTRLAVAPFRCVAQQP